MRIGTKIITGYGVLIALMALVLAYQVVLVHRLQSIHRNLAEINFQAMYEQQQAQQGQASQIITSA